MKNAVSINSIFLFALACEIYLDFLEKRPIAARCDSTDEVGPGFDSTSPLITSCFRFKNEVSYVNMLISIRWIFKQIKIDVPASGTNSGCIMLLPVKLQTPSVDRRGCLFEPTGSSKFELVGSSKLKRNGSITFNPVVTGIVGGLVPLFQIGINPVITRIVVGLGPLFRINFNPVITRIVDGLVQLFPFKIS